METSASASSPSVEYKKSGESGGYINMDSGAPPQQLLKGFKPLLVLTEVLGLVLVVLVAVWCGQKGFGWTSAPALEFNWHPLLMVIALIFLNGNAILTFRVLRNNPKPILKYIHGGIQFLTLPLVIIGLVAVFDSHNYNVPPTPNLYSLHSWIGLGAVILFFMQWVIGLTAFLFPGLSAEYRSFILPLHVYNGVAIFALSVGASLLGLNEKAFFVLGNGYGLLPAEAVLINMIGVVMTLFALLVGLLVTKSEFKRTPLPEDGSPLLSRN